MLYHEVKSRSLRLGLFGPRAAYFDFFLLADGRTVGELSTPELTAYAPRLLTG